MKTIVFTVLIFVALSFAQKTKVVYDTTIVKLTIIDTVKVSEYSLALKALENSQKFYKDSFSDLLTAVGISLTIISIIFAIIALINHNQTKGAKKELEKTNERINNLENERKERFGNLEKEIEQELGKLEKDQIKNNVFREISKSYLISTHSIKLSNGKIEILDFFHKITFFYHILHKNEVELNDKDIAHFNAVNQALDKYILSEYSTKTAPLKISEDKHTIGFFLLSLQKMIEYCKKTGKKEQEKIVMKTWEKSCDIFGGVDEVNMAIEYYKNNPRAFNI